MQAMDAQLQALKGKGTAKPDHPTTHPNPSPSKPNTKGKAKAAEPSPGALPRVAEADEDEDEDTDAAMSAELHASLARGSDSEGEDDEAGEPSMDYNLIKNFLESFKSQGGLSGPVGNLAGRLEGGWGLPRDN